MIEHDEIDILFDLSGHTAHHRLLTFARKPAPVQVAWIGYAGTTGFSAIDYLLADSYPDSARKRTVLLGKSAAVAQRLGLLRAADRCPRDRPLAGRDERRDHVRQLQLLWPK